MPFVKRISVYLSSIGKINHWTMKQIILILFFLLTYFLLSAQLQEAHYFNTTKTVSVSSAYAYLLFTPSNTDLVENGKLPLIVFLHGAGERGDSLDLVKVHGPPMLVDRDKDFPFMVLSPQCAGGGWWEADKLDMLIDEVVKNHAVDVNRIYLTGLSMGGYGSWDLAQHRPDRFAAVAPICGGSRMNAFMASKMKAVPTWTFHGAMDSVVPLEGTTRIVKALKDAGADVQYTIYPMAGHNSWTETYDNPDLYTWFLSHRLSDRK